MGKEQASLLEGRNLEPLSDDRIQTVYATFHWFDRTANVKFDGGRTRFSPVAGDPNVNHRIFFGPDIFPGQNIGNPNSCLSMRAAVVHELTHRARHDNGFEVNEPELEHIDEALTSLSAILQFQRKLEDYEILELVADAVHRLQKFVQEHQAPGG